MKKFLRALTLLACSALSVAQTVYTKMNGGVNLLTGVTTYVFTPSDVTKLTVFNASSPVSVTMPKGNQTGFGVGTDFNVMNIGSGTVTIGCTGCNINGTGNLQLVQGAGADIYSMNGDYYALLGGGGGGGTTGAVLLAPVASQTVAQPNGTNFIVNQNLIINGSGSINGLTSPDSGSSAQTLSANNTAGFFSGSVPVTSTCYAASNIFQPLFSVKASGVAYSTGLESFCNKDQLGGYPSLDPSTGIIPNNELVLDTSSCDSSHVIAGDQSRCVNGASSPGFDQIAAPGVGVTKSNSGPGIWQINSGLKLQFDGAGGVINANQLNYSAWPSGKTGGALNIAHSIPIVVSANAGGSVIGTFIMPDCFGVGAAIGFMQSGNLATCQNVALNAAHPMILLTCNGTNGACPSTPAVTSAVINTNAILYSFTLAANQLSVNGQCVNVHIWLKHSTGTTSTSYAWNVGGTGGLGTAVSGGNTTSGISSAQGGSAVLSDVLHICRSSNLLSYLNSDQWAFGSNTGGGTVNFDNSVTLDWSQAQQVNLIGNVSTLTDAYSFYGGEVYYP